MGFITELIAGTVDRKKELAYQRRLEELKPSYDSWIRAREESLPTVDLTVSGDDGAGTADPEYTIRVGATTFRIVPMSRCAKGFTVRAYIEDVIVFTCGELTPSAFSLMDEYFLSHPKCMVLTGDEDIAVRDKGDVPYVGIHYGSRRDPYFKPRWSPTEFASHFYFCNILAVRRIAVRELAFTGEHTGAASLYHNLSKLIYANDYNVHNCVGHIGEILIHAEDYDNNSITDEFVRESARLLNREGSNEPDVSAVILTKENVPRLSRCLGYLTEALNISGLTGEIIVMDDHSSESSRRNTVDLQLKYNFRYEYRSEGLPESRLLSQGVEKASGKTVLFLRDGLMFEDPTALKRMYDSACFKFSGITGIKIIKKGTDTILHAGISLTRLGLMYRLKGLSDLEDHGNGYNRFDRNAAAVTLDCAMFRRKLFDKVGGFGEDIPETFKDADLCLKLTEAGYYNAVCNSVSVLDERFESELSEEVIQGRNEPLADRLRMLNAHPMLKGRDPYCSARIIRDCHDVRILPACEFEYGEETETAGRINAEQAPAPAGAEALRTVIEYSGTLADYLGEEAGDMLYVQGHMHLEGYNNACFSKSILLSDGKTCYEIPVTGCYRSDVAGTLADTSNIRLSGISLRIPRGAIEAGTYQIGARMKRSFPKKEFVNYSDVYLVVVNK